MAFKFNSFLFVTLSIVVVASTFSYVSARVPNTLALSPSVDDWQPIKDLKDPKVIDIANFAIKAYNDKTEGSDLKLKKVLKGKFQVVATGITYRLLISTTDEDFADEDIAVVFENCKDNVRKLISFLSLRNN
ncbi:cysteine proteinase inhibitor 5 [Nicotiana tabacum]|uniref:Cysteine protease inhibitor n=1 Tax=Nicotiana tabacum TaxID=4097 RepID=A0A075F939_TOBAC|nr:PREDICTED: cysteine proteinase inhibitor 5-like [Nicotiana tabacum]AIE76380.1 cysteine protease inhibitor [Nicotiana tabacum]